MTHSSLQTVNMFLSRFYHQEPKIDTPLQQLILHLIVSALFEYMVETAYLREGRKS